MINNVRHIESPGRIGGILFVVILHACAVYALVNGLEHRVVDVPLPVIEARIIQEERKPSPPKVILSEAPKVVRPRRHVIPPPETRIVNPPPSLAAITAVSTAAPSQQAAPTQSAQAAPVRVASVLDAARSCRPPQYPVVSQRKGETGVVTLTFLIEENGHVVESKVVASSGFERLDEAALQALSLCRFKPGSVDGVPERSWARLRYVWKLN